MLLETIRSTLFCAYGDHVKHKIHTCRLYYNCTLADDITILHLRIILQFFPLADIYITDNFMYVKTVQGTQLCTRRNHERHTIPCLRITLQFHASGDNTKHTILHPRRPHKAHNSTLVDHITISHL